MFETEKNINFLGRIFVRQDIPWMAHFTPIAWDSETQDKDILGHGYLCMQLLWKWLANLNHTGHMNLISQEDSLGIGDIFFV